MKIPLINSNTINGVNPPSLNVRATYTLNLVRGDHRSGAGSSIAKAAGGGAMFDKPFDNIGDKMAKTGVGGGAWVQVSRLGNPLVNEVIIGLDDKDRFNAAKAKDDAAKFADYVTHPVLPALIETLFPAAKAPTNFPRTDLLTVFLTGIKGLNQPTTVAQAEIMRLNTSVAATAPNAQNSLGVATGDNAGYLNGRRPGDDIVDLSLRVAMGALCVLTGPSDTLQVVCKPANAPAGGLALTDGARKTAAHYGNAFPYLTTPLPGNLIPPPAAGTLFP